MHIFSYVITHDAGFAPNPYFRFLTLATCKPQIRKSARKGDFVIGTGSASTVGNRKLVYAARITAIVPIEDYGDGMQYKIKQPTNQGKRTCGDNIYFKVDGKWKQRRNKHHSKGNIIHDLSGKNVLICRQFSYFGDCAIEIPPEFQGIIKKGPGHKRITDPLLIDRFAEWFVTLPKGIHGSPEMNPELMVCDKRKGSC